MDGVVELSVEEFRDRMARGESPAILDVREDHERDYARLTLPEGATDLHIPLGEVARRFEEIRGASLGRGLVVYCHHGQRSMVAATWLEGRGIAQVCNLGGGIDAWSRRIDPAVRRY